MFDFLEDQTCRDRRGRPISLGRAAELKYRDPDYDRVGSTNLELDGRAVWVSTVWLGPLSPWGMGGLFETMTFTEDDDEPLSNAQWRWPTLRAAEIGHRRVVRVVKLVLGQPVALAKPHRRGRW